jgi:hypothetical protein
MTNMETHHWSEWHPGPEHPRANVMVRKDALLYYAMVDKALDGADTTEWCWDGNDRGIWVARSWFEKRGGFHQCKT